LSILTLKESNDLLDLSLNVGKSSDISPRQMISRPFIPMTTMTILVLLSSNYLLNLNLT